MSIRKPFRAVPLRSVPQHGASHRRRRSPPSPKLRRSAVTFGIALALGATFIGTHTLSGSVQDPEAGGEMFTPSLPALQVHYRRCDDARAAGAAPIYAGQPGYRPELDRDSDGIACEPYRGG